MADYHISKSNIGHLKRCEFRRGLCFLGAVMQSLNDGALCSTVTLGTPFSGLWNGRIDAENIVEGWEQ